MGGGIHHVDQCLRAYLSSDHYNEVKLLEYAEKQNNGALFKRLGYLLSLMDNKNSGLISYCKNHITKGISSPGTRLQGRKIYYRMGLKHPQELARGYPS